MTTPANIVPGQRWASEAEPELGLGVVESCAYGRLGLYFPAADERRLFALSSAPVRRVRFVEGDQIETREGRRLTVERVSEADGLLVYETERGSIPERELADTIRFAGAEERLLAGIVDELDEVRLRVAALSERAAIRRSPARGFLGARIDLLPHQIATAREVAARAQPRVLLADEVGLGKTIEACLIVHRLLLTGRAERVLIIVPETLVHQWFVELLRRFNLSFSLFDEERFASLRRSDPAGNPFVDSQWVLASERFLSGDQRVAAAVLEAPWDVLVVDEAHHLEWTPEAASPAYALVEALAARTEAVLLLTATPQQLGDAGHFARLRLLDPDRYDDLKAFRAEAGRYHAVADLVERLEEGTEETLRREQFAAVVAEAGAPAEVLDIWGDAPVHPRGQLVGQVIDAFGPGRVLFRSTRAMLGGFPRREAVFHPLRVSGEGFAAKVRWLVGLLHELPSAKLLVIAHTRGAAEAVVEGLQAAINVNVAVFHEGMTLLQRDRQAAYFADPDGARLLVCSEIGSEGRNFQFAHHLVLFDLPPDPELLEQRIGRLDRIGQRETISIHVPFVEGSREEAWARWYHEGLNAFEQSLPGGHGLGERFAPALEALAEPLEEGPLESLLTTAREAGASYRETVATGLDRLLGVHPPARTAALELIERIEATGRSAEREAFLIALFDACGLAVEELGQRRYRLVPGLLTKDALPGLPENGMTVTFDRADAVAREDLVFLSVDHPLVVAAFDLHLGAEAGNSGFAAWPGAGREGVALEAWILVEPVAPRRLHVDRFLPPTPLRVVVDHGGAVLEDAACWDEAALVAADARPLLERGAVRRKLLPAMPAAVRTEGTRRAEAVHVAARPPARPAYGAPAAR